jgi:hypothetical protein
MWGRIPISWCNYLKLSVIASWRVADPSSNYGSQSLNWDDLCHQLSEHHMMSIWNDYHNPAANPSGREVKSVSATEVGILEG